MRVETIINGDARTVGLNITDFEKGLRAMPHWYIAFKYWTLRIAISREFWAHWWTPIWHNGKGPYITIGILRIYRGY